MQATPGCSPIPFPQGGIKRAGEPLEGSPEKRPRVEERGRSDEPCFAATMPTQQRSTATASLPVLGGVGGTHAAAAPDTPVPTSEQVDVRAALTTALQPMVQQAVTDPTVKAADPAAVPLVANVADTCLRVLGSAGVHAESVRAGLARGVAEIELYLEEAELPLLGDLLTRLAASMPPDRRSECGFCLNVDDDAGQGVGGDCDLRALLRLASPDSKLRLTGLSLPLSGPRLPRGLVNLLRCSENLHTLALRNYAKPGAPSTALFVDIMNALVAGRSTVQHLRLTDFQRALHPAQLRHALLQTPTLNMLELRVLEASPGLSAGMTLAQLLGLPVAGLSLVGLEFTMLGLGDSGKVLADTRSLKNFSLIGCEFTCNADPFLAGLVLNTSISHLCLRECRVGNDSADVARLARLLQWMPALVRVELDEYDNARWAQQIGTLRQTCPELEVSCIPSRLDDLPGQPMRRDWHAAEDERQLPQTPEIASLDTTAEWVDDEAGEPD